MNKAKIAILGLGEAGSSFANDLVELGYEVSGWDPNPIRSLNEKVRFAQSNIDAVNSADIILNVNWSRVAHEVAKEVKNAVNENAIFCEMNTSSPQQKMDVENILKDHCQIVDVAIMGPVPNRGIRTPFLISGTASNKLNNLLDDLDNIEIADGPVGKAAERKLLRSIVYKGIAAVLCEAMEAAKQFDSEEFMRTQIKSIIGRDTSIIDHFITGSKKHAVRRSHEMEAVSSMLSDANLSSLMSEASVSNLQRYINKVKQV